MIEITRKLDVRWIEHHDHVITKAMNDLGFELSLLAINGFEHRCMGFDHESFKEEQAFYNLAMIDRVAEKLPGIGLEVRLFPIRGKAL